jgi:hypothetical protein
MTGMENCLGLVKKENEQVLISLIKDFFDQEKL